PPRLPPRRVYGGRTAAHRSSARPRSPTSRDPSPCCPSRASPASVYPSSPHPMRSGSPHLPAMESCKCSARRDAEPADLSYWSGSNSLSEMLGGIKPPDHVKDLGGEHWLDEKRIP